MIFLRSAIDTYPQPIDVRYLTMEVEFFSMEKDNSDFLLEDFLRLVDGILGDQCIVEWRSRLKTASFESIKNQIHNNEALLIGGEGAVKGRTISTISSLRRWFRKQESLGVQKKEFLNRIPKDYLCDWEDMMGQVSQGRITFKEAIQTIFLLQGKKPIVPISDPEIYVSVCRVPGRMRSDAWDGEISLSIAAYCIEESVNSAAEEMTRFLKEKACIFGTMNARVLIGNNAIPSKASPHMTYFSQIKPEIKNRIPKGHSSKDWGHSNYLCGAEWFNVVSPLVQKRVSLRDIKIEGELMPVVTFCKNGTAFVQCSSSIETCTATDLAPIKQLLYDMLYPGFSMFPKNLFMDMSYCSCRTKPRMWWEEMPLFDFEIEENETEILLIHKAGYMTKTGDNSPS